MCCLVVRFTVTEAARWVSQSVFLVITTLMGGYVNGVTVTTFSGVLVNGSSVTDVTRGVTQSVFFRLLTTLLE